MTVIRPTKDDDTLYGIETIFVVIKWTALLFNVLTLISILDMLNHNLYMRRGYDECRFYTVTIHCLFGILAYVFGSYAAVIEDETYLILFAILLLVNMAIAIFLEEYVQLSMRNLTLYTVCAMMSFIEAYLLRCKAKDVRKY